MKGKGLQGRLALLLCSIIWGTSFVVLKNTLNSIGTMWVLSIRFTVSALLLGAAAGKRLKHVSQRCIQGGALAGLPSGVYLISVPDLNILFSKILGINHSFLRFSNFILSNDSFHFSGIPTFFNKKDVISSSGSQRKIFDLFILISSMRGIVLIMNFKSFDKMDDV